MQEIEPEKTQVNLPALPQQMVTSIAEITHALGIPRDVLAPDSEIAYAWQDLPRELQAIPPHLLGELIARMCVAIGTGLFDGAISYIWNATILHLRQRIRDFGLPVVSQILQERFEESDLIELQDSNLIDLCLQLDLVTEDGWFFLNQCRETRNNFSAAHPAIGKINDRELITFINRCTRYALSDEISLVGIDITEFMNAVKGKQFTSAQCDKWIDRFDATHDPQRQLLFGTLHGIYCDPASPEEARLNALELCEAYQVKFTAAITSDLIDRHSNYIAKGDTQRHNTSQQFFEKLGLIALLKDSERHSVISSAVNQLWDVHLAMNNFYNEPPFAERLLSLSEQEAIPETIQEKFVHTVIGCYIGNGFGVSRAAIKYYEAMIRSFSPREISILVLAHRKSTTIRRRIDSGWECRSRFGNALQLVNVNSCPAAVKARYNRLISQFSR